LLSGRALGEGLPGESYRNHLVFSLGVGVGSLSPATYNAYTDDFNVANGGTAGSGNVNTELHVPILVTYYAPFYLLLRSGVEAVFFTPSETIAGAQYTNYGGIAEVPIEFGGHYALLDEHLILELAAGPAIDAFTSAGISNSNCNDCTQLYGGVTVGFDSELKAQYFIAPGFSIGLEVGYRILSSGALHSGDNNLPIIASGKTVTLDTSGFRGVLELGFRAF
jgi:hypothetical protein